MEQIETNSREAHWPVAILPSPHLPVSNAAVLGYLGDRDGNCLEVFYEPVPVFLFFLGHSLPLGLVLHRWHVLPVGTVTVTGDSEDATRVHDAGCRFGQLPRSRSRTRRAASKSSRTTRESATDWDAKRPDSRSTRTPASTIRREITGEKGVGLPMRKSHE